MPLFGTLLGVPFGGDPPLIQLVSPSEAIPIADGVPIVVDVTPQSTAVLRTMAFAHFPVARLSELVDDGTNFGLAYIAGSQRSTPSSGVQRSTFFRSGGWRGAFKLEVLAFDSLGQSVSATFDWEARETALEGQPDETPVTSAARRAVRTLALDETGDLLIQENTLRPLSGRDAIAQACRTSLRLFRNEWFLDPDAGLPYYERILQKSPDLNGIQAVFQNALLAVPGVRDVLELSLDHNRRTRQLTVRFRVSTDVGEISEQSLVVS